MGLDFLVFFFPKWGEKTDKTKQNKTNHLKLLYIEIENKVRKTKLNTTK